MWPHCKSLEVATNGALWPSGSEGIPLGSGTNRAPYGAKIGVLLGTYTGLVGVYWRPNRTLLARVIQLARVD